MRAQGILGVGLALSLALALLAAACSPHTPAGARAGRESCPGAAIDPALFKRIQGTWQVDYRNFRRGAKPPGLAHVGELTIEGCRYRFTAVPDAVLGDLGRWLPFVRRTAGAVEIVGEAPVAPAPPHTFALGTLRLHGDPAAAPGDDDDDDDGALTSVELRVLERLQEGEYLTMTTTGDEPAHTLSIHRGARVPRPDEFPGSSDPNKVGPGIEGRLRGQARAAAEEVRWREEAAARAATPAERR